MEKETLIFHRTVKGVLRGEGQPKEHLVCVSFVFFFFFFNLYLFVFNRHTHPLSQVYHSLMLYVETTVNQLTFLPVVQTAGCSDSCYYRIQGSNDLILFDYGLVSQLCLMLF